MLRIHNTCQDPVGVKKFEFLHPFSKATEKISISCFSQSCFALNQFYNELTTKKMLDKDQQCFAFTPCV